MEFPHFTILRASAGSGKTYALARRFVLFLLSPAIPKSRLCNLLAITFSNNAAREMKERILSLLKQLHLGEADSLGELSRELGLAEPVIAARAGEAIEELLSRYGDFQVKTIDSFMTTVFKASALDFGYNPDFEILMSNEGLMGYAFDLFLRRVREGTREAALMDEVVDIIVENRSADAPYPWEATAEILDEIARIYRKVASCGKPLRRTDHSAAIDEARARIDTSVEELEALITGSGLVRSKASSYPNVLKAAHSRRFSDLIGRGMKSNPVCKPAPGQEEAYLLALEAWERLGQAVGTFTRLFALSYYTPYLLTFEAFGAILERVKRSQGKIFIEDVNKRLAEYLDGEMVPDVYFRLGETVYHYLIDEFQDTSPIQWRNLMPLIENSLSQGGSLFVVGDTKQAIYGFRDADYRIMRGVEACNPFPCSTHSVEELHTNYRSDGAVVAFSADVFQRVLPLVSKYRRAGEESGLVGYRQAPRKDREERGFVETRIIERDDRSLPEREAILGLLDRLFERGYDPSDVTVLTSRNEDVVKVTSWLNSRAIPFVSYSSLDIRRRPITGEIVSLLTFLDSPLDDLSFATFILGDIMKGALEKAGRGPGAGALHDLCFRKRRGGSRPLYKLFQEKMQDVWDAYFDRLFRLSGYLPLYDLVVEIYRVFGVFDLFPEEEAALAKILEVIREAESTAAGGLRRFLQLARTEADDEADWDIDVPHGVSAVRVMTVHKAKGLGFPVVILLLYGERGRPFPYAVQEDEDSVCLLRLTRTMAQTDEEFGRRYEEEETKDLVARLNSLYVAFTRAGSELYVLGVKGERDSFPFNLLPQTPVYSCGCPQEAPPRPVKEKERTGFEGFDHVLGLEGLTGGEEPLHWEEKKRGELVHAVFALVEYADGETLARLDDIVGAACREAAADAMRGRLRDTVVWLACDGPVAGYYGRRPDRRVLLEQELADGQGQLFRADRIVVDPGVVTVIEYKTGRVGEDGGKHMGQMANYLRIVGEVYKASRVEGIIAYVDAREVRRVAG